METWQWAMLAKALDGLYHMSTEGKIVPPLLTDYAWVEKAYEGEMTAAGLTWLNTIVFARSNGVDV
jgi:N-acetylmuramoyl-L-alanine amidase